MASQESQRSSASARTTDNLQQMVPSPRPGACSPFAGYPPCFMMPFPPQPGISGGPAAPWPYPPVPMPSWGTLSHPHLTAGQTDSTPDHYTVDSMRRIYSNEDASIEIERVKVQRRQQQFVPPQSFPYPCFPPNFNVNFPPNFPPNFPLHFANMGADPKGLVPAIGPNAAPVRRPPPRKNRKNKLNNQLVPSQLTNSASYPPGYPYPTPYFSYVPYPYPYPYFSYPALQNAPVPAESLPPNNGANPENSQNNTTQRINLLESSNSQQIDAGPSRSVRDSISPDAGRPLSPNAPSQISLTTESLGTDINPSDSVSVGGYRKSGRPSLHEGEKDNHWIIEMQRHLASIDALSEDGDRSSFATAQSDVPTPPIRRRRQKYDSKQASIDSTSDHNRRPLDIDKQATADSVSEPIRPSSISQDESVSTKPAPKEIVTPSDIIKKKAEADKEQLRQSRQTQRQTIEGGAPHGTTQPQQPSPIFADDLSIKTKTSAVDCVKTETSEITDVKFEAGGEEKMAVVSPPTARRDDQTEVATDDHSWVLLTKDEAPDVASVWLADVSVWRARLVVSLDKGQGLDQQDWATFHLLTQHPLPITLKLSMLHAPRLCAANANVGAVQVRAALLQLAWHAQVLLQAEDDRPPDWKSISASLSQPWAPVKGGKEILRLLGFRHRDDGSLRYSRRLSLEASHLARLTLDMLLLADELRLYLTGGHPHPSNISDLFCPVTAVSPSPNCFTLRADGELMPVYHSSTDFISAETTPVFDRKVEHDKQLEDLNDLGVNDSPLKVSYNEQLLHRTSSEEDITLHESGAPKERSTPNIKASAQDKNPAKTIMRPPSVLSQGGTSTVVSDNLSASTDIASLPELQSAASPVPSNVSNYKTTRESPKRESIRRSPETSSTHSKSIANAVDLISARREDHIYEEIGEIRSQVQKLRTSVSVPNLPPPLPPKCHSMDEDNSSTYSRSDWSAASSIGGSTGRRRRKRRAPLPPSFMRLSIKENLSPQGSATDQLSRTDKQSSTSGRNPFYDEIGENKPKLPVLEEHKDQESKGSNPFHDTRFEPSGYVGANPFYEDVKKVKMNSIKEDATRSLPESEKDLQSTGTSDRAVSNDQFSSQQLGRKESVNNEQDEPTEYTVGQQTVAPLKELQKNIIVPSDVELHDVDLNSTAGDNELNSFQAPSQRSLETQTKNVEQKQHLGSQGVVSVDLTSAGSNDTFTQINGLCEKPDNQEVDKPEPSTLNPKEKLDNIENLAHAKCSSHGDSNSSHQIHSNVESYCENSQNLNKLENEIDPKTLLAQAVIFDANKSKVGEATMSCASSNGTQPQCTSVISDIPYIDSSDVISYKALRDSSFKISSEEICPKNLATRLSNTPPLDPPPPPPPTSSSSPPSSPPPSSSSLHPSSSTPPCLSAPIDPDLHQPRVTSASPSQKSTDFLTSSPSQTKLELFEPLNSIQPFTGHMDIPKENKPTQKSCIIASATPVDKNEQVEKLNFEEVDVKSAVVFSSSTERHSSVRQGPVCGEYYEIPELPEQPPPLPAKPNSLHLQKAPELPPKLLKSHTASAKENSKSDRKNEASTVSQIPSLTRNNNVSPPNRDERRSKQPVDGGDSNLILLQFSHGEEASKITDGTNTNEVLDTSKNETLSEHFKNHSPTRSPSKPPRRHRMAPQSSTMPRLPPKKKNSSSPNSHTLQQKYRTLPTVSSDSPETKKRSTVRLSLSTPSSPKPSTKPSPAKLSRTSKTRKSWPFLLCDCFYTDQGKHESNRSMHRF